jgi:predicted Zn-dependent peptidase
VKVGGVVEEAAKEKRPVFVDKDQEQVTYNTGWLTCSVRDADYVPLRVAISLMGDRVFFKRHEKGVAYRSWFYMNDRIGQSSAQNEMGVTPSNYAMASSGVLADFGDLFGKPVSATDLKRSTDKLLALVSRGAARSDQVAARLAYFEAAGLGYDYPQRYPDLVRKVTPGQVRDMALKYFDAKTWTRVAVGKESPATGGARRHRGTEPRLEKNRSSGPALGRCLEHPPSR